VNDPMPVLAQFLDTVENHRKPFSERPELRKLGKAASAELDLLIQRAREAFRESLRPSGEHEKYARDKLERNLDLSPPYGELSDFEIEFVSKTEREHRTP
jgi:hypothetical protein